MPERKSQFKKSDLSLIVEPETIRAFEASSADTATIYERIFEENEKLALWIRQRAEELSTDQESKEAIARIGLEVASVAKNQAAIDGLKRMWEIESVPKPPGS